MGVSFCMGEVVEDVRTVFEKLNDTTIHIPDINTIKFDTDSN